MSGVAASPRRRVAARADAPTLALAALVLLAAALRFATLTTQSVWFDEAATWDVVRRSFGGMLDAVARQESTPPLYYVLEWLATRALGDAEAGLRALSALAGTLTVLVAFALGRRLAGPRAGLAAAALVAVNPLLVWFSQEARAYALVVLLSALSLLVLLRALEDPRARRLAAWTLAAAAALATHYFAVFVLAPEAAWLLWRHPRRRAALAAVGALVVAGAAHVPLLLAQRGNPYDIGGSSLAVRVAQVPKQFLLGYRGPLALPLGIAGAALALGGAWLLLRRTAEPARRRALAVAGVGLAGIALPLAGALAGADYLNARNVLPALVPLLAALGVGLGASAARRTGAALLAALCALSLAVVVAVAADPQYQRPDWRGLARALGHARSPRAIVVSPANGTLPLRYYRRALRPMPARGAAVGEVDVVAVAGAAGAGAAPSLPAQIGTTLVPFPPPSRASTDRWVILRFRAPQPLFVAPPALAQVRFSPEPPAVELLPPGG